MVWLGGGGEEVAIATQNPTHCYHFSGGGGVKEGLSIWAHSKLGERREWRKCLAGKKGERGKWGRGIWEILTSCMCVW